MRIPAFILCLLCVNLQAQTWIYTWTNGKAVWAQIDPATVKLDTSVSPPVLRAIVPPSQPYTPAAPDFVSLTASQATFALKCGSVMVFRNGLMQSPSADYTVTGTSLTFKGGDSTPQAGDLIAIIYRCQ